MIISASRRTDIPALYPKWMLNRLREGEALFKYPRNPGRLGRVCLSPETVDCIVFWTKNPLPMLERLDELDALRYSYYFTYTITPYSDMEPGLPPIEKRVETFLRLSDRLGKKRVDWRMDPLIVDGLHDVDWNIDRFGRLCEKLAGATERCIMNPVRHYKHLGGKFSKLDENAQARAARGILDIAATQGLALYNCAGKFPDGPEIGRCACIDAKKIGEITGRPLRAVKDPGQPKSCHCAVSIDIGEYDSCTGGCAYCYANRTAARAADNFKQHDPDSPLLIGRPLGNEIITDRTAPSLAEEQLSFFD